MRFIVFKKESGTAVGLVEGDRVLDLSGRDDVFRGDLLGAIGLGGKLAERVKRAAGSASSLPLSQVKPALPVARPGKVICLGLNYLAHAQEGGHQEKPTYPSLFMRGVTSLMAAGEPLVRPKVSDKFDYEAELMLVIGKRGRHVSQSDAYAHIFGYTLFNDGSVRDYQRRTAQWTPGKNFDATGPVGPVVVTPDELPDGAKGLRIQSRINGQVLQDANTRDMIFPVAETIQILSEYTTLEPGDLVAMGTPEGVGYPRKPPIFMKPGDTVEIEIEKIGILSNPVMDEAV